MEFEITTIGAGRFLFELFQIMAAVRVNATFELLIVLAGTISLALIIFQIASGQRGAWEQTISWVLFGVLIMGGLTLAPARVKVTDRIDHVNSAGYIVDGAPLLLAGMMSVTTRIGDAITEIFETNLAAPNDPVMSDHGFLFGVDLIKSATELRFSDPNFRVSLSNYIKSCTMTELAHGHKTLNGLAQSDNAFDWLMTPASQVHFFQWVEASGTGTQTDLIACNVGATRFQTAVGAQETAALTELAENSVPEEADATNNIDGTAMRSFITNELEGMHRYLMDASQSATDILRQQMTINLFRSTQLDYLTSMGAQGQVAVLRDARARIQEQHTNSAFANIARTGVPVLYALFQIVFIGMFPIISILMFTLGWKTFFKNYFLSLIAFETWAPMFAVLHWVMNADARHNLLAKSEGGITLATQDVVDLTHNQISNAAGHWLLMIPVASMMIFVGFRIASHFAGTALQPSLQAGSAAAADATTGNHSYGNMSYENASYFNESGLKTDTNFAYQSGQASHLLDSGATRVVSAGGQNYDTVPTSNLGGSISFSDVLGQQYDSAYTQADGLVQTTGNDLTQRQEATLQTANEFGDSFTRSQGWGNEHGIGTNANTKEEYNEARNLVSQIANKAGVTDSVAASVMARASVGIGGGAIFKDLSASGQIDGSISKNEIQEIVDQYNSNENVSATFDKGIRAFDDLRATDAGSNATSFGDRLSAHESEITTASATHGIALSQREELQDSYRQFEAQQATSNIDHTTAFRDYWEAERPDEYHRFLNNPNSAESRRALEDTQNEYVENYRERNGGYFDIAVTPEDLRDRFNLQSTDASKVNEAGTRNAERLDATGGADIKSDNARRAGSIRGAAHNEIDRIDTERAEGTEAVIERGSDHTADVMRKEDQTLLGRAGRNLASQSSEIADAVGLPIPDSWLPDKVGELVNPYHLGNKSLNTPFPKDSDNTGDK